MSQSKSPSFMHGTGGTPLSSPEPEISDPPTEVQSVDRRIDILQNKLRQEQAAHEKTKFQLFRAQVLTEAEMQGRKTVDKGLQDLGTKYDDLSLYWQSNFEDEMMRKGVLRQEIQHLQQLTETQKTLISTQQDLLDYRALHQLPQNHFGTAVPMISNYQGQQSQSYQPYTSYSQYEPLQSHTLITDSNSLREGHDFLAESHKLPELDDDYVYSIGSSIEESGDVHPDIPSTVGTYDYQPRLSIQSILHPISAERHVLGQTQHEGTKGNPEDLNTKGGTQHEGTKGNPEDLNTKGGKRPRTN